MTNFRPIDLLRLVTLMPLVIVLIAILGQENSPSMARSNGIESVIAPSGQEAVNSINIRN